MAETAVYANSDDRPDASDALFDTSPTHLAEVFGRRTIELMRTGRDPFTAARLAATFAFRAKPSLRLQEVK